MRSYDEYCAIAKSLDVVGDRWTLLIVRELASAALAAIPTCAMACPGSPPTCSPTGCANLSTPV